MANYELTITRAERNPFYKEPPQMRGVYDYGGGSDSRDTREPHEREFETHRVLHVSLTEAEYVAVKQGVMSLWSAQAVVAVDPHA